jgi:hypothetical protein
MPGATLTGVAVLGAEDDPAWPPAAAAAGTSVAKPRAGMATAANASATALRQLALTVLERLMLVFS